MLPDLPGSRSARRLTPISFGATRSTRSPEAAKNRSKRPETCRQSSSAKTRSAAPRRFAQRNSASIPA
jgi:hypothetical protein